LACQCHQSADFVFPHEPFFGLSTPDLFWILGGFALISALAIQFNSGSVWPPLLSGWLALNFLVFQLGLYWQTGHGLTGYLGGFTRAFGVSARTANVTMLVMTAYLIGASACLYLGLSRVRRLEAGFFKIFCPACGGHIKFLKNNLGQKISCPHCQADLALNKPDEKFKISCFFCQGHIEFPVHALGRKIPCPHCKMDITLQLGRTA
jgi:hypothetical protein